MYLAEERLIWFGWMEPIHHDYDHDSRSIVPLPTLTHSALPTQPTVHVCVPGIPGPKFLDSWIYTRA